MNGRSFSVRFNESFIANTKDLLSEDDLKKLSAVLCDDPFGNNAHGSIENLYHIEWEVSDPEGNVSEIYIWYVADSKIDHIEIIAHTTQKDDDDSDQSDRENTANVKRYVRLLVRLLYAAYRLWKKWNDDDSDGPDFEVGP